MAAAYLGEGRHPTDLEEEALHTGLSLGMTLIDTSGAPGQPVKFPDGTTVPPLGQGSWQFTSACTTVAKVEIAAGSNKLNAAHRAH